MSDLSVVELREIARSVADSYDELSRRRIGRAWTEQELALGLVGDVGDLGKFVMALTGTRDLPGASLAQLEHEICDVIWVCIVLADRFGLDLTSGFPRQMADLQDHIQGLLDR